MSNPFFNFATVQGAPEGNIRSIISGDGGPLSAGGLRKHGVTIPNYVGTVGQGEDPVPMGASFGKPAYFRFAVGSSVDRTSVGTRKALNSYYGETFGSHALAHRLAADKRTVQSYINFNLQKVNESFQEKYQLVETFGDSFVGYFFGQRTMVLNINGILIDDQLSDAKSQFIFAYNTYLRGFHTAKHKILTEFGYGDTVVKGVLVSLITETGDVTNEVQTNFSAQMLVYTFTKVSSMLAKLYDPSLADPYDIDIGSDASVSITRQTMKKIEFKDRRVLISVGPPPTIPDDSGTFNKPPEDLYEDTQQGEIIELVDVDPTKVENMKDCTAEASAIMSAFDTYYTDTSFA